MENLKESHNRLHVEDEHEIHVQELMQVPSLPTVVLGQAWHAGWFQEIVAADGSRR